MKNQLIIIDSKDRDSGSIADFSYTFEGYPPAEDTLRYRINKITIPYAFYQTVEQEFTLLWGPIATPTDYVITLPAGNYTPTTLSTALNTAIADVIGPNEVLFSFDPVLNIFNVQAVNVLMPFQLKWDINNLDPNELYKSVGIQMGFLQSFPYTRAPRFDKDNSLFFPNLTSTKCIYIKSQALAQSTTSFFNKKRDTVIQSVIINVNPEQFITFENQSPIYFPLQGNLSTLDFQLLDDYGQIIDLELDWCLEIQYEYPERIINRI